MADFVTKQYCGNYNIFVLMSATWIDIANNKVFVTDMPPLINIYHQNCRFEIKTFYIQEPYMKSVTVDWQKPACT